MLGATPTLTPPHSVVCQAWNPGLMLVGGGALLARTAAPASVQLRSPPKHQTLRRNRRPRHPVREASRGEACRHHTTQQPRMAYTLPPVHVPLLHARLWHTFVLWHVACDTDAST